MIYILVLLSGVALITLSCYIPTFGVWLHQRRCGICKEIENRDWREPPPA